MEELTVFRVNNLPVLADEAAENFFHNRILLYVKVPAGLVPVNWQFCFYLGIQLAVRDSNKERLPHPQ